MNEPQNIQEPTEFLDTLPDLYIELIEKHFPGAQTNAHVLQVCKHVLELIGISAENTLYAQSVCPDHINSSEEDLQVMFSSYLGDVFMHLGGLAGLPFTGSTGFSSFTNHTPENGHLFFLFSPHIGINTHLELGYHENGAACEAAVAALKTCGSNNFCPISEESLGKSPCDFQMNFLIKEIYERKEKILNKPTQNEQQAELVMQIYNIGEMFLEKIVSTKFGPGKNGKLILLGGIQINLPSPMHNFFLPLLFECREEGNVTDFMHNAFGQKNEVATWGIPHEITSNSKEGKKFILSKRRHKIATGQKAEISSGDIPNEKTSANKEEKEFILPKRRNIKAPDNRKLRGHTVLPVKPKFAMRSYTMAPSKHNMSSRSQSSSPVQPKETKTSYSNLQIVKARIELFAEQLVRFCEDDI